MDVYIYIFICIDIMNTYVNIPPYYKPPASFCKTFSALDQGISSEEKSHQLSHENVVLAVRKRGVLFCCVPLVVEFPGRNWKKNSTHFFLPPLVGWDIFWGGSKKITQETGQKPGRKKDDWTSDGGETDWSRIQTMVRRKRQGTRVIFFSP